jgi:lysophospholipase L1-like esterase
MTTETRARTRQVHLALALVAGLFGALGAGISANPAVASAAACGTKWVSAWGTSPSGVSSTTNYRQAQTFRDQTLRMVITPTLSGGDVRLRLTGRYSTKDTRIGHVTVALRASGASAVRSSIREVTFGGAASVVLAAGRDTVSDPVDLDVASGQDLLVSLYLPGVVTAPTEHFTTLEPTYLSLPGTRDRSSWETGLIFPLRTVSRYSDGWYFLAGLDVRSTGASGAVVAFGDSTTDGFQGQPSSPAENLGSMDGHTRYTDFLAGRLATSGRADLGVINAGVSGNQLFATGDPSLSFGRAGRARFADDVLAVPGVTDVIIAIGSNDIGHASVTAERIIRAKEKLIARAHAAGLRVHLATMPPTGGAYGGLGSARVDRVRRDINDWTRQQGLSDSVVDFDQVLSDPKRPARLRSAFDSGDHAHPSAAGYRAMSAAVRLSQLTPSTCG